jgi:hypothetical protein
VLQVIVPIEVDRDQLQANFEDRPIRVNHDLEHNLLFQVDALLDAADQLPRSLIECNVGQARARIYKVSHYIRDLGVSPLPYGLLAVRDGLKSTIGLVYQRIFAWRKPSC